MSQHAGVELGRGRRRHGAVHPFPRALVVCLCISALGSLVGTLVLGTSTDGSVLTGVRSTHTPTCHRDMWWTEGGPWELLHGTQYPDGLNQGHTCNQKFPIGLAAGPARQANQSTNGTTRHSQNSS